MTKIVLGSCLSFVAFLLVFAMPAVAKDKPEWRNGPLGNRFTASIGYYKPTLNTSAAISDANGNLGAQISFEDTLGLADSKGTGLARLEWRISNRNVLSGNYFKLDRNSDQDSTLNIFVANPAPPPDFLETEITLPISAQFNIESYDITYAFNAVAKKRHILGVGLGLALQKLQFGFRANDNCTSSACALFGGPREAKSTAPLPTFKLIYRYAINDKWSVDTSVGYFALSLELDDEKGEEISGSLWNVAAGIRWKTWKHAGFNVAYKFFDVDLDYERSGTIPYKATADYDYRGFVFGLDGYF